MPNYKYDENVYLDEVKKYLDSTYGQHYVAKDIQVVDIWNSLDSLETTSRDTAIKYLCRYGKKDGKNKKDLLKAIHYIILMMYAGDQSKAQPVQTKSHSNDLQDAYDKVNNYDTYLRNQ